MTSDDAGVEGPPSKGDWFQRAWSSLGPGVITGAADDDPSGIATYSITGAQFGNQFAWVALLTWPLMGCVQMMAARIGMVSGAGLAGTFRQKFPRWVITGFTGAPLVANTINIASDLAAMGGRRWMLGGGPSQLWVALFGVGICLAAVLLKYRQLATILQWLALALFAYALTAFMVKVDWHDVLREQLTRWRWRLLNPGHRRAASHEGLSRHENHTQQSV